MLENNNFFINENEQSTDTQNLTQEEPLQQETTMEPRYTVPEAAPKKKSGKGKRVGFAAGIIAASLVIGSAAGFGGSALYSALNKDTAAAQTAENTQDQFPFGGPGENGQMQPGQGFGQMPEDGEMPEGNGSFGQTPDQEGSSEEEDSEIGNGVFPFNKDTEEKSETENKAQSSTTEKNSTASLALSTKSNGQSLSTEEIVSYAADAVVEITTEYVQTGNYMQQYVASGAGSGVIVSEDGYIITNNHVIEDATQITVTTTDGTSYEAKLVGRDDQLDVALLKIDASGLTVASFGDSDAVNLGENVVAIGNPLGQLGGTVTQGIVSSLNREITIDGKAMTLMQTDAAINPGNSGGGLFNDQGQLIGLVVAKSEGEDVEGIGFAIPINSVQEILDDLLNYGYTKGKAYLGVSLLDIRTEQMARMYHVLEQGTYIYSVTEDSAAAKAGLQSGDLVLKVNGKEITSTDDVKAMVQEAGVDGKLTFTIVRNGQQGDIEVTVGEYVPSLMPTQSQSFGN